MTDYALYRGDNILMVGTLEEIAKSQGVEVKTARLWSYQSYIKLIKDKSKAKILYRIEDEEDD